MSKYLVIGLGSMGKRRVRCLKALGIEASNIIGMDIREDRCKEAIEKCGIQVIRSEEEIDFEQIKAVIVSLPPDKHAEGAGIAFKNKKPVFVEASVVLEDVEKISHQNDDNLFVAPSCTFIFHPMIKKIKEIVDSNLYGKVCNFSYHSGQYLPDWHPWEDVKDFYVSHRETGGAREIVPYELTWICDMFGFPLSAKGYFRKTGNIGCDIEDSYVCSIDYGDMLGSLVVDVVGRNAARNLIINFEQAQLQWRWDAKRLEIYEAEKKAWKYIAQEDDLHEEGYNANIGEKMYIEEIEAFLKGIDDHRCFPNSLQKDMAVLKILNEVEDSDGGFYRKKV